MGASVQTFPLPDERVAIVGSGPSALHFAHLLKKRGFSNVVIFERSDRRNGKTVTVPDQRDPEVLHELGTCYLHPAYNSVRALATELGVGDELPYENIERSRVFTNDSNLARYTGDKGWMEFDEWIYASVERHALPPFFWFLPDFFQTATFGVAALRYIGLHEEILGRYDPGFPPQPSAKNMARIAKPLGEFLEEHDLMPLGPIFGYAMTAQGYGSLTVPTFYAMIWITPALLRGYLFGEGGQPKKSMFTKGFGAIWDRIVERWGLEIRYQTEITTIERSDERVLVAGTNAEGRPFQERFDYLIYGAPLAHAGAHVDLDEEEQELFGALTHYRMKTTLIDRDPEPDRLQYHADLWMDHLTGATAGEGEVHGLRDSSVCYRGPASASSTERREQVIYQFVSSPRGEGLTEEEMETKLDRWIQKSRIPGVKKLQNGDGIGKGSWEYFYHWNQTYLSAGMPWKLQDRQGQRRTLWVHASCTFESVLDIVLHNEMLVAKLTGR